MAEHKLPKLILKSYHTVRYFKTAFDEYGIDPATIQNADDLQRLPLMTKEMVQKNPGDFIAADYSIYPKREDLVIKRTSGSTGNYLKVFWDKYDEMESMIHLWRLRKRVSNIFPDSKFCSFYTTIYRSNKFIEPENKELFFGGKNLGLSKIGLNEQSVADYYQEVLDFNPEWMMVQPSIAFLLAEYINENGLQSPESLKYIELTGEFLLNTMRDSIEKAFRVPIRNQYGCNEANAIAMECEHGHLHCIGGNVIVEVMENGRRVGYGREGDIYITSLTNTAMPFIRYAVGDRGILSKPEICPCGNSNDILQLKNGRNSEYILMQNGTRRNSYIFLYTIEHINEYMGNFILQFRITQQDISKFTAEFVIKDSFDGWAESIKRCFLDNLKEEELKNAHWEFFFVKNIYPDNKSGKVHGFVNRINRP